MEERRPVRLASRHREDGEHDDQDPGGRGSAPTGCVGLHHGSPMVRPRQAWRAADAWRRAHPRSRVTASSIGRFWQSSPQGTRPPGRALSGVSDRSAGCQDRFERDVRSVTGSDGSLPPRGRDREIHSAVGAPNRSRPDQQAAHAAGPVADDPEPVRSALGIERWQRKVRAGDLRRADLIVGAG